MGFGLSWHGGGWCLVTGRRGLEGRGYLLACTRDTTCKPARETVGRTSRHWRRVRVEAQALDLVARRPGKRAAGGPASPAEGAHGQLELLESLARGVEGQSRAAAAGWPRSAASRAWEARGSREVHPAVRRACPPRLLPANRSRWTRTAPTVDGWFEAGTGLELAEDRGA